MELEELNKQLIKYIDTEKLKKVLEFQLSKETLVNFSSAFFRLKMDGLKIAYSPVIDYVYPLFFLISEEYYSVSDIFGDINTPSDLFKSIGSSKFPELDDDETVKDKLEKYCTTCEYILKYGVIKEQIGLYEMLSNIHLGDNGYTKDNLKTELTRIFNDTCAEFNIAADKDDNFPVKQGELSNFVNIDGEPAAITKSNNIFKYSRLLNGITADIDNTNIMTGKLETLNIDYTKFFQKFLENISARTINY